MNLLIKDFPDDLHRLIKARAALEGKSIAQYVIEVLHRAVKKITN